MLRVGAFTRPSAFILTGTSDIVGQSFHGAAPDVPGLLSIPRECAPLAVTYGPTQSSGDAVDWLAKVLDKSVPELMLLPPAQPDAPAVFVPYLRGERAPLWNAQVRAGFFGLSAEHAAGDLVEAVLQGISLGARQILEAAGTDESAEVHIAGVSASIERWTDARLQTLGRPLVRHSEDNASAVGAAILGAAATGRDLAEEVDRASRTASRADPTPMDAARAKHRYAAFTRLSKFALTDVDEKQGEP
jgi:xylulokinase